ncbi:MAG: MutS-related protein [Jejuia sp.]
MSNNPQKYYKNQKKKYKAEVKRLKKQLITYSTLRLLTFFIGVIGVYYFYQNWQIAVLIALFGIGVFLFLLSKYTDIKHQKNFYQALVEINAEELKILSGDFLHRLDGLEFQDPKHFYSLDIDLFGRGSFFQWINRTTIHEGKQELAYLLKANNIVKVQERQKAVKNLAAKPQWRQFYSANTSLVKLETPAKQIITWLQSYSSIVPKTMKWFPWFFSIGSIILFILTVVGVIVDQKILGYWLFIGLGITGVYVKKINLLSLNADKAKDTFRQYAVLLDLIENETFTSELLQEKQKQIQSEKEKASVIFKKLSNSLDALDNRNNIIGAIFGNGLFLTDLRNAYHIEKWIKRYGNKVADWFDVVSFFDAYNSLGNFAFNHPSFVYPEITSKNVTLKANGLGHPLLHKGKRVNSDVLINAEQFFIVTGANMAGKSTFLRTVSLHIVMANVGLPVCAISSSYNPIKLITSMRTSDSLTDDSSYFFSELTRLKYIIDTIKEERYFIILDEILKGTNSTDKAIGSRKFVEKLVASNATGIIATHDLSLCDIANELDEVKNYFFDAEIVNDELYFDYKLKKGVCQNMNASFLLKTMEII